ncbi:hypothetical protein QCD79_33040, partial [Pseudomonas quasicaspiana]|nr:hypothetical protein [Pseudomonas quasicaspiana]
LFTHRKRNKRLARAFDRQQLRGLMGVSHELLTGHDGGIASDGTIVSGQQFMGDAHESSQLLAIKRPGQPFVA